VENKCFFKFKKLKEDSITEINYKCTAVGSILFSHKFKFDKNNKQTFFYINLNCKDLFCDKRDEIVLEHLIGSKKLLSNSLYIYVDNNSILL
jgi:hypothetical protein